MALTLPKLAISRKQILTIVGGVVLAAAAGWAALRARGGLQTAPLRQRSLAVAGKVFTVKENFPCDHLIMNELSPQAGDKGTAIAFPSIHNARPRRLIPNG